MTLNGIDISNYQRGININAVPCDFVIVKSTEGTGYTSPSFNSQINAAANAGKLLGVYHYINGVGAQAEMQHFYNVIKPWIGKAIICLDWEAGGNAAWGRVDYLRQCIEAIKNLTGQTIMVYAGPYQSDVWAVANSLGCRTWKAQYASNANIYGYQAAPWNEGAYHCDIRQYSGAGRLDGYGGDLDLDKAYITAEEWNQIAGTKQSKKVNDLKPIYNNGGVIKRCYNEKTGEHLPCSENEAKSLKSPWKVEGDAFTAPKGGTVPVFRMNNPSGFHILTANYDEAVALQKAGWEYEEVPFFGNASGTSIYRIYNPNNGDHLLTKDKNERDTLVKAGWKDEGIAFYV